MAKRKSRGLGRRKAPDNRHREMFPLTATTIPAVPTPVVIGINWYSAFDQPVFVGNRYWIGKNTDGTVKTNLGQVRGGHAICIRPETIADTSTWYRFYDQGNTGQCVGFSTSRMMSLLNRHRFDAAWLYCEAFKLAGQGSPCDPDAGTFVRSAFEVLRTVGHRVIYGSANTEYAASPEQGISAYRWATSVDDILSVLGQEGRASSYASIKGVPLVNSWGISYPATTWMPLAILDRVVFQDSDGEAGVATDR